MTHVMPITKPKLINKRWILIATIVAALAAFAGMDAVAPHGGVHLRFSESFFPADTVLTIPAPLIGLIVGFGVFILSGCLLTMETFSGRPQ